MNARSAVMLGLLVAGFVSAQEPKKLEGEEAKKIATRLTEASAKLENTPFKVTPDIEKAGGLAAKKHVALLLPDTGLKLDTLKKIDREIVPLGLLYTHKMTLVVADQSLPEDQQRTVEIEVKNEKAKIAVMHLAAAKVAGRLVLLVYTNGKTPAMVTTLAETEDAKDLPLDVEGKKAASNQATLLVTVLGKYRAAISVAGQE